MNLFDAENDVNHVAVQADIFATYSVRRITKVGKTFWVVDTGDGTAANDKVTVQRFANDFVVGDTNALVYVSFDEDHLQSAGV